MAYLFSEHPAGTIDGSNTLFVASHGIAQLNYVSVDGALYTGNVSVVGSRITLSDAPTESVQVSYYVGSLPSPLSVYSVQEAYDLLARDLEHVADMGALSDGLFLDFANMVDRSYYQSAKAADPLRFAVTEIVPVTSTERSMTITTMGDLRMAGCGVFRVRGGRVTDEVLMRTYPGSSSTGYYTAGSTVCVTGREELSVAVRYVPVRPRLTAFTDSMLIPTEYTELLLRALRRLYDLWDGQENITTQDALFRQAIEDMASSVRPDGFAFPSYPSLMQY